jgi:putative methionine-R-sulfoxide reductase with GAF domain
MTEDADSRPDAPSLPPGRLSDVESLTDTALSWLDEEELLAALLERVRNVLGVDTAAVLLLDRSARELIATAASGIEEEVRQGVRIPLGAGFAGRVAASREPVILNRVDHTTVRNPLLVARGIRSLLGVPLVAAGAVIGVLHVGSLTDRVFGAEDVELLRLAADRAAFAVHSMMAKKDRSAAIALHRSLLPSGLPEVPGTGLAARYVTGSGNVGGDWYDAFVLPSGKVGLVVGDVAGSGLGAAVIMGRMRSSLRSYALESDDPAAVLRRLDRKIQHFESNAMATVLYGIYAPDSGQLMVSSAGHLPPVLAFTPPAADDAAAPQAPTPELLPAFSDLPIGVADDPVRRNLAVTVPEGALLCCYTDGLVERRDRPIDEGLGQLADTLAQLMKGRPGTWRDPSVAPPLAEEACGAVMRAHVGNGPAKDDIAVLMLHRFGEPARGPAGRQFAAGRGAELGVDVLEMRVDAALGDDEALRDGPGGEAFGGARGDFAFAPGEGLSWVRAPFKRFSNHPNVASAEIKAG